MPDRKIVILIYSLSIGGAERLVVDQVNELVKRGIRVSLITLHEESRRGSFLQECLLPESDRYCVPFESLYSFASWRRLVTLLTRLSPNVLFTHLWFANTVGRIAGTLARVRRIISFEHNVYDRVKTSRQFFADRCLQIFSVRIVAVSEAVRDSLIVHGIRSSRIIVLPNGVDLARYRDAKPAMIGRSGAFVFLFVGRLISQKGVDILLNAFAQIEDSTLTIVGDGNERRKLEDQAHMLGIEDRVQFLGVRHDVPALMKATDCFILPSRWEGMGIVLVEAFAAGCPVIASDFGPAREVLQDGISGLIVPTGDADALAGAMRRIATDPMLRATLKEGASREVERFSIGRHVDILLSYAA